MQWPNSMPKWVQIALTFKGSAEIPGKATAPFISKMLKSLKAWWTDDETPWCGVFVGYCLQQAGVTPPAAWYRAKAYNDYGSPLSKSNIPFGAICTKTRTGGGHVFFAVARSADGKWIFGLGGNQGNKVSIMPFDIATIDQVRWPVGNTSLIPLPVSTAAEIATASVGSSEA